MGSWKFWQNKEKFAEKSDLVSRGAQDVQISGGTKDRGSLQPGGFNLRTFVFRIHHLEFLHKMLMWITEDQWNQCDSASGGREYLHSNAAETRAGLDDRHLNICSLSVSVSRRSGLFVLSVHRAGPEDVRGSGGSGLWGDQHRGGPAESPRRENRLPAAARLRPRPLCSDGARRRWENRSGPDLRQPEDHHPTQRDPRPHRVPHLRHQTQNLELTVIYFHQQFNRMWFIICFLAAVCSLCTLIRLW